MENILVEVIDGFTTIDGKICSYDTEEIRGEILSYSQVNKSFNLPRKYHYVVTPVNGFAKIIRKAKPDKELSAEEKAKLGSDAIDYMIKLLPPDEYGENMDADCLQQIICDLSGYNFENHK